MTAQALARAEEQEWVTAALTAQALAKAAEEKRLTAALTAQALTKAAAEARLVAQAAKVEAQTKTATEIALTAQAAKAAARAAMRGKAVASASAVGVVVPTGAVDEEPVRIGGVGFEARAERLFSADGRRSRRAERAKPQQQPWR